MIRLNNMMKLERYQQGKGDDYTTGCLLDFAYFEKNYKIIVVDLSNKKHYMLIQEQYKELFLLVK